jgi:hypothetical protein
MHLYGTGLGNLLRTLGERLERLNDATRARLNADALLSSLLVLHGIHPDPEAVMRDVEDRDCLAVTLDDDPAAELLRWQRRFLYFRPDEIEPLETRS